MRRWSAVPFCWLLGVLGCGNNGPGPAGDPCLTSVECQTGTVCFPTAMRGNECMTVCDPTTTRLCEDGSVCMANVGEAVCYTGGELALGSVCVSNDGCAPGAVCIQLVDGAEAQCRRACDRRTAAGCALGEVCTLVGEEPAGFCAPAPSE